MIPELIRERDEKLCKRYAYYRLNKIQNEYSKEQTGLRLTF